MTENTSLFDADALKRTRKVAYKKSTSKDGNLHIRIAPELAAKIKRYCKMHRVNCSDFVNQIVNESIDDLVRNQYESMTKEELIDLLRQMEKENAEY